MCPTSVSGCSGVGFASAAPDLRLAQSVLDFIEVDLRLALGGFAERDDADFMFILRVYDRNRGASEQAQRNEALLAVGETVILEGECHAFKNTCSVQEVKAVSFDVRGTFRFGPSELHTVSVYTKRIGGK